MTDYRYNITRTGTHYLPLSKLNDDVPSPCELVFEAVLALNEDPGPSWMTADEVRQARRVDLANALRDARRQGWRFHKITEKDHINMEADEAKGIPGVRATDRLQKALNVTKPFKLTPDQVEFVQYVADKLITFSMNPEEKQAQCKHLHTHISATSNGTPTGSRTVCSDCDKILSES